MEELKKNKFPLVSVIVPLYNYRKYIGYCVKSILNQTYKNFELIVVDDCSTDDSYKTVKKFEKEDSRVKVIKLDKNYGYSTAKNKGIVRSKGEYIVTLDADDMMTKKSLEVRLEVALKHKIDFVFADAYFVKGHISLKECYKTNKHRIHKSLDLYNIHAQSVLLKREVHIKYGLYDENLRSRSDREMWWRLFGKSSNDKKLVTSYYINKPVAYYRYHRYSMWRKRKRKKELDNFIIKESEKSYNIKKIQGITNKNTIFLEK
jgi:teichuronic acid biosynthesis glycosyltransferase TuaG